MSDFARLPDATAGIQIQVWESVFHQKQVYISLRTFSDCVELRYIP